MQICGQNSVKTTGRQLCGQNSVKMTGKAEDTADGERETDLSVLWRVVEAAITACAKNNIGGGKEREPHCCIGEIG
jgi:hypothetical protein